jgi:outer membrane biosynthesis protein TonB
MAPQNFFDEPAEERSFFKRFGPVLGLGAVGLVVAVIFLGKSLAKANSAPSKMPEVTMVKILATPPPPPPPPPAQPKLVEEKMVEQMPVDANEAKPEESAPAPAADLGTSITGPGGADGFGLGSNRGTGALGGSATRGSGSKWGWYAAQVQSTISDALRKNVRTREASFRLEVRVWPDLTGRITRAQLAGSTGDAALDAAIKGDVLANLQLKEAPPQGMPLPIVLRLTARRTN